MNTAASAFPAFLRSFDLPEPGELRHVAKVCVWARWFVLSLATFAWLYPPDAADAGYAPSAALAALLFATNGYLHYRLATERTVSWRWMLALSALDVAMLSAGVVTHDGFKSPFLVGYYPFLAMFAVVFGSVRLTLVWVTMTAVVYAAICLAVEPGLDFSTDDEEKLLMRPPHTLTVISLGGGVQSSVMALMANEGAFDRIPDCAIFADTRWEPPSIYEHLTWLKDRLSFPPVRRGQRAKPPRGREGPHQPLRLTKLCGHPRLPQGTRRRR